MQKDEKPVIFQRVQPKAVSHVENHDANQGVDKAVLG